MLRSLVAFGLLACLHDGPDAIGSWRLSKDQVKNGTLVTLLGVDGRIEGKARFVADQPVVRYDDD